MYHGVLHFNNYHSRKPNADLQASVDTMIKTKSATAPVDAKATIISIPVMIKGVEAISYDMLIGEKLPAFTYWPRGREIFHRLIMRAAMTDDLNDLKLYQTDD